MNDDLLRDLGLDQKPADVDGAVDIDSYSSPSRRKSVTALNVDQWTHELADRLYDEEPALRSAFVGSNIDDRLARHVVIDAFAAAFNPSIDLADDCENDKQRAYFAEVLLSPDFAVNRRATMLNTSFAVTAAAEIANGFVTYSNEVDEQQAKQEQPKDWWDVAEKDEPKSLEQSAMGCVAVGVNNATRSTERAQEMSRALVGGGCSMRGDGDGQTAISDERFKEIFAQVKDDSFLRKVLEFTGRYRRVANSAQRGKLFKGRDEFVGYELAGDITRVVSTELALLSDEDLENEFLMRLAENKAMCRKFVGNPPVGKGPVLVYIDESGSMDHDDRIYHAKALALSIAWVADYQNRWCGLVGYSRSHQQRKLSLPPGKWNNGELVDWLRGFYRKGTHVPLPSIEKHFQEFGCPRGETDLIVLTDGVVQYGSKLDNVTADFLAWKEKNQCKATAIIVGNNTAGDLDGMMDNIHFMPQLDANNAGIKEVLSI